MKAFYATKKLSLSDLNSKYFSMASCFCVHLCSKNPYFQ
ncbi:hypothetical protein HDEF_0689 [Candidatus Hamiltonella defensa 5AT (Acyrthosiphon pisum)]|uniref:Uncharacterized protein n=1 Tax=Hamiltonella defensa subsp. Acyrthosiphon pisum (strain 5AT) TaxID=572265 RepID=C4K4C9_HAMD5|nr:hypothetical protein HDEF_0689 [Candidatus Hamiltonella defensa 5AT (Acyrthosiphon pisum)]